MSYTGSVPDTLTHTHTHTTDWLEATPCKADPDAMFPGSNPHDIAHAKAVCNGCTVRARCLQWALDTGEEHGVWGGLAEDERRKLRRRAARTINLDEYAGTHTPRQKAGSLEEAWKLYTLPDGDHLLWTGPRSIHRPRPLSQVTPARLAYFLDRGRWPEGDTKRTCGVDRCVKPAHLQDRGERAELAERGFRQADFQALLDAHTVAVFGGHLDWPGTDRKSHQGRQYSPRQIAFIADRGRRPEGAVRTGCAHPECVLPAHLSDQAERDRCGTRAGYLRHRRRDEDPCPACRQANTDADNRLRRTGTTLELAS